jgi:hypothetical protein
MATATSNSSLKANHLATDSTSAVSDASFNYYSAPTPPRLNDMTIIIGGSTEISSRMIPVTDLRSLPMPISGYNHESHGFQILHQELPIDSSHASVHDLKVMTMQYYPAMITLLKKELGIRSAAVVNNTLRDDGIGPFFISHSDYTAAGARGHLRAMTPAWFEESQTEEERAQFFLLRDQIIAAEDAAIAKVGLGLGNGDVMTGKGGHWDWDGTDYEGPRYGIFSIWRPWETVKRDPLALMDTAESDVEYAVLPRTYYNREGYLEGYYNENSIVRPPAVGRRGSTSGSTLVNRNRRRFMRSSYTTARL